MYDFVTLAVRRRYSMVKAKAAQNLFGNYEDNKI